MSTRSRLCASGSEASLTGLKVPLVEEGGGLTAAVFVQRVLSGVVDVELEDADAGGVDLDSADPHPRFGQVTLVAPDGHGGDQRLDEAGESAPPQRTQ